VVRRVLGRLFGWGAGGEALEPRGWPGVAERGEGGEGPEVWVWVEGCEVGGARRIGVVVRWGAGAW